MPNSGINRKSSQTNNNRVAYIQPFVLTASQLTDIYMQNEPLLKAYFVKCQPCKLKALELPGYKPA